MNRLCLFFAGAGSISFRPEGEAFLSLIQVAQKVSTFVQAPEHHVKALQPCGVSAQGFPEIYKYPTRLRKNAVRASFPFFGLCLSDSQRSRL
jgi:hypothetical protein